MKKSSPQIVEQVSSFALKIIGRTRETQPNQVGPAFVVDGL